MECPKVIVDCDAGTDDALALIMLIAAHRQKKVEILGITCVTGNTFIDNVVNNVFRTLKICDALDIPVYKGAYSPLLPVENDHLANYAFHGSDGFGDIYTDKPDVSKLKEEHAVCALNRITSQNYGEVTLLCLAPLTNIALTIKMYPEFKNSVKKLIIMGGNLTAVGNITSQAEFNFYADPESAHIVMCNVQKKLWLLPWETCMKSTITHEWRDNVFGKIDTPVVNLMNTIDEAIYTADDKAQSNYMPCDAFIIGILLRPDIAKDIVMHHIDIELRGLRTRGQVVIDHLMSNEPNAYVIQNLDFEIFKDLLIFAANPNTQNSRILLKE